VKRILSQSWAIVLLLVVWAIWVRSSGLNGIVIVSPVAVARELIHNPAQYLLPAVHTAAVAFFGIVAGLFCGLLLAIAAWSSRILAGLSLPVALLLTSVPVVCLIPVLSRIFGYDDRTVFVTVVILCFLPAFVFASAGLRALPPMAEEYFLAQGAGRWSSLWRLALPAAVPRLAVALRVLALQSVLSALVAEFLMQTGGLGLVIATATADLAMDQALAASFASVLLALLLYLAGSMAERAVARRYS
jgi:ABC-type nitrate/sulfonate/bicarbonate transport system permease component